MNRFHILPFVWDGNDFDEGVGKKTDNCNQDLVYDGGMGPFGQRRSKGTMKHYVLCIKLSEIRNLDKCRVYM